jgi:hypothetical protein
MKKLLAVLLILASQLVLPEIANAACTSSTTSGSVRVGSQIVGNSVVVCASKSAAKTTTTNKTVTVVKKVSPPTKVAPPPCVIKVSSAAAINDPRVPGCSYQIVTPPKPSVAAPKSTTSTATSISNASDQAAFVPNPVAISSSSNSGLIGQSIFFSAIASAHSRTATILGQPAQVNFTPVNFAWSADDGAAGAGASFANSWSSVGSHSVSLIVDYSVSYTLGSGWVDAGIIASSAAIAIAIGEPAAASVPVPAAPVLVSGNCKVRPGSYRC